MTETGSTGEDTGSTSISTIDPDTSDTIMSASGSDDTTTSGVDTTADDTMGTTEGELCGNGELDDGEECDGTELGGADCESEGFDAGRISCAADCTLDVSGCMNIDDCGNDAVDGMEVCDGTDLDGEDCISQGFDGGTLGCEADCTAFDTSMCTMDTCGDDMIDGTDVCDGTDLGGEDCVSQGFGGGMLACLADCTGYDTSGCMMPPACGNGAVDPGEACDGMDLAGEDCMTQGFGGGMLACDAMCQFDTSGCMMPPACGNGAIDPGEACDGMDLGGEDCVSQGFGGGMLGCDPMCQFDTSGCMNMGGCEDEDIGMAVGLGVSMGDTTGDDDDLAPSCGGGSGPDRTILFTAPADGDFIFDTIGSMYDTKLALFASCDQMSEIDCNDDLGAGMLQSQLQLNMTMGQQVVIVIDGFNGATGAYTLNITQAMPAMCGDGMANGMEDCDGMDLAGEDCISQGFAGGGVLACDPMCVFDTSGCMGGGGGGGCCSVNGSPGCEDPGCEAAICGADPFCCSNTWDQLCADAAAMDAACMGVSDCGMGMDVCGDGMITGAEACDGMDLAGEDCITQGFMGGVLACDAVTCQLDTSGCMGGGAGGCCSVNGSPGCEDPGCEAAICGADPFCCSNTWDQLCADAAAMDAACMGVSDCGGMGGMCGDGMVDPGEACDGMDLAGEDCVSQGFPGGGVLACDAACGFDTSGCMGGGGAGGCCSVNGSPGCEDPGCEASICGADPFCCSNTWDQLCADAAAMDAACMGVSDCGGMGGMCGNGMVEAGEACDGMDLAGEDCVSQGFAGGGVLACDAACGFDTSGCMGGGGAGGCCSVNGSPGCEDPGCEASICGADPFCCSNTWDQLCADAAAMDAACMGVSDCGGMGGMCGNGMVEAGEACDGMDLAGEDCVSQGFAGGGVLACDAACGFDTSGCMGGGGAGGCCSVNGSPGCEDAGCEAVICGADPFCCSNTWDQLCVNAAVADPACMGVSDC